MNFASIPSIESLLQGEDAALLIERYGRAVVVDGLRAAAAQMRSRMAAGGQASTAAEVLILGRAIIEAAQAPHLRPVINLTGTVLHTNLGRAPLPESAIAAMAEVARGASNLEFSLEEGGRGDRDDHLEPLLCRLTGGEAATIVNNNAAAVLLVLNTLALRKEVLVSRGELIEIGGSFRMPEIMARAGSRLREVGTTNRTHLRDFEAAISPRTGLIMKVHKSNFAVEGFTSEVSDTDLARLGRAKDVPYVVDLGSGSLVDLGAHGLPHEPTVSETLAAGADLVTFSGDKLLGGPQTGLIVGRRDLIRRLKANPLKRALRCDKLTIASLAAVLQLYADPDRLPERLPTLALLTRPEEEIARMAAELLAPLGAALAGLAEVEAIACDSQIGSGARPTDTIPSAGLRIVPLGGCKRPAGTPSAKQIAGALRSLPIPVIGRIQERAVILDLRCLTASDDFIAQLPALRDALASAGA